MAWHRVVVAPEMLDAIVARRHHWLRLAQLAEDELTDQLEQYGDRSHQVRFATEQVRRYDFASIFWYDAPPMVRGVLEAARRRGATTEDLRLVSLCKEVRQAGGSVLYTPSRVMPIISKAMAVAVFAQWTLMDLLIVIAPTTALAKVGGIVALLLIFCPLYRIWSMFGSRAVDASKRVAPALLSACAEASISGTSNVAHFTTRTDRRQHR